MAKVKLNPSFMSIRGHIGDLVYRKNGDKTAVAVRPGPSTNPPTRAQLAVREQFRAAAAYAKAIVADPVLGPRYAAAAEKAGLHLRAFVMRDFLTPPVMDAFDASGYHGLLGEVIKIRAFDDFEVASVMVAIRDATNTLVEQGDAALASDGLWHYSATVAVASGTSLVIEATAKDHPGNATSRSEPLVLV